MTRRRLLRGLALVTLLYVVAVAGGCFNPSVPFDIVVNLQTNDHHHDLTADPSERTLVVLQHGLWRSASAMWRLERSLEWHGYAVLNFSYSSTQARIEDHAKRLGETLEEYLAEQPEDPRPWKLCFVGHSMGGLVIRCYLQQPNARKAHTCVFIATPHRGAALVDERKDMWLFDLFMGDKAALQLSPSDPLYDQLGPVPCQRVGTIVGRSGDPEGWNEDIPGDDDGTVGVDEAQLPEQTDVVFLECGHTVLGFSADSIEQVLAFLKHGRFRKK